jgi:hypothetical protein
MASSQFIVLPRAGTLSEGRARYVSLTPGGVLVFLFASNVFDPGGKLGLKYIAFLVATVFALWTLKYFYLPSRALTIGLILFLVWPTWSLLYGIARRGDLSVGLAQVTPFLFAWILVLILPIFDNRTPLRIFYTCIFWLSPVVIASFLLVFMLPDSSIGQKVFEILSGLHEREGYFGMQSLGDVGVPIIYFASTLFLVPAFVYHLFAGKMLRAGVVLLAIGVTFSKAGLTIALVFGAFYSISAVFSRSVPAVRESTGAISRKRFRRFLPVVVIGGAASALLASLPAFYDDIRDAWTGESQTAIIRIAHFHSVMNLFLQNPHYLIIGQGAGVPFHSLGASDYVQNFEIDHLNTIRKFGLPWFIGFSAVVFYSAYKLISEGQVEGRALGYALISIYLAAGTNPVLISPLFIMVMTLSYFAQRRQLERPSERSAGDLQRV